ALTNNSQPRVVRRYLVGTHHRAVFTADALVIQVPDNSGQWVFVISFDGTPLETARIGAVVAGRGHMLQSRSLLTDRQRSDASPAFVLVQAVQSVASHHASFATAAGAKIYFECIML